MVEFASLDGRSALDLLAAGASGLGRDVVGSFVGVHLAAEVDGQADEEDHHEAGQGQPDGDGAALVVSAAHRSRQVSIGLDMVARMTREPGTPGTARSERSRRQETVTSTEPGTPGCLLKSVVSTVTSTSEQPICWLAMLARRCLPSVGRVRSARRARARPTGRRRRQRTGAPRGCSPYARRR